MSFHEAFMGALPAVQVENNDRPENGPLFEIVLQKPTASEKKASSSSSFLEEEEGLIQEASHVDLTPLDPAALSALLSRLPEPVHAGDGAFGDDEKDSEHSVHRREASLTPPPKSGMLLPTPFPPPPEERPEQFFDLSSLPFIHGDQEEEQEVPPLAVTRFTPSVPLVEHALSVISLTFSQPMVALSSISQVEADTVALPISLTPHVDGKWRWLGTQTIQFEAKHRFSFSTTFMLSVAQSCKSSIGGTLSSPFSHTFSTLPPIIVHWSPSFTSKPLSPLFLLCFNQQISVPSILSHIYILEEEGPTLGEKFADGDFEIVDKRKAQDEWPGSISNEVEGMWVAFRLKEKLLQRSTSYVLCVPPGCPSAEGDLTSTENWSASFTTYGPLTIASSYQYGKYHSTLWHLEFSNELDHTSISKSAIHISPSIEEFKVSHTDGSSVVVLQPAVKFAATYVVTVDMSIKDIYGQCLDESKATAEFKFDGDEALEGFLAGPPKMVVLNPLTCNDSFISLSVLNFSSLRIQVVQVEVDEYSSYMDLRSFTDSPYTEHNTCPLGKKVHDQEVELQVERDEPYEYKVSLGRFLQYPDEHFGQLLVIAEPTQRAFLQCQGLSQPYKARLVLFIWVQCTQLSLDVFPDNVTGFYTAWVTSLESGVPVSEATVRVGSHMELTDDNGLAVIKTQGNNEYEMICVQKGKDLTFMPSLRIGQSDCESYEWYVFDSRGLYKPTEEVHIKGYVRKVERKKGGGQQPVLAHGQISYAVKDARRNKLTEGDISVNEFGSFFFTFVIPDNANLGDASVRFEFKTEKEEKSSYVHTVMIQEFRKPEFEVKTTHWAPSALYAHPSRSSFVIASTSAKYYSGGPLEGARVSWIIRPSQTRYIPPGHIQYMFGCHDALFLRAWGCFDQKDHTMLYPSYEFEGNTDMDGQHDVKIQFKGIEDCPSSISVSASSSIIDINNQVCLATTTFIIHPAFLFVGFKLKEIFASKGEEVIGEVIVCDVDGKLVKGVQVKIKITGEGKQEAIDNAGLSIYEDVLDEQEIAVESDEKSVEFSFIPQLGGVYHMVFRVADSEQRWNESQYHGFFVSGGCVAAIPRATSDFITQEEAHVIPNKVMYEAGETATLLVRSPFWPAEGLLIIRHWDAHVGEKVRFSMLNNMHMITVCLDPSWIPTVDVQVLLVGSTPSTSNDAADAKQVFCPAFATAVISVNISASYHKLALDVAPMRAEETATPGETVHVSVKVTKQIDGEAVENAEISVVVVDEAILSLTDYVLSDPLSSFYPARHCYSLCHHLRKSCLMPDFDSKRELLFLHRSQAFAFGQSCPLAYFCEAAKYRAMPCSLEAQAGSTNTIRTRSNFNPLAAFVPHNITDAEGLSEVKVQLPDNLTRYRIWVVAATQTQFGLAESFLTVQLPVMLHPSPPRFLNLLDRALVSVVLQNRTNLALPLVVGMRKNNAKVEAQSVGYSLILPSSRRIVVAFPVLAVDVGKASLQVVVSTSQEEKVPSFSDASEIILPIFTPVSSECFATYGDVADEKIVLQSIKCPSDAFLKYGGLDVSISSTTLQSLTDALLYLYTYPFECNEQLASRIIGFLSLWEVLQAFQVKDLPSKENVRSKLKLDLQRLKERQLSCGGWSWWTSEGNPKHQPFISLHVSCALVKASKLDVLVVDSEMLEKALGYCAAIESHLCDETEASSCLEGSKYALLAYALYVQALSNKNVGVEASRLLKKASLAQLSLEACGWILIALGLAKEKISVDLDVLLNHVKSRVVETSDLAHFTTSYQDDGMSLMLHSNSRTDAILLEALLVTEASSALCAKLAKGLQARRKAGKWSSTQENCFVLVALNMYFRVYEKEEPNFTTNVWLGEQWVMSHTYSGRTIDTKQAKVPMPFLLSETKEKNITQLVVQKNGEGRLYFRIGLEYAPRDLQQAAASYGFSVKRTYEGVHSPLHAVHDPITKAWKLKAGEKVRVKLTLGTTVNRYHVALVDFIPAGCEPINPNLERSVARDQDCCIYVKPVRSCWMEHVNTRDERVEAFCTVLRAGQYEYSYEVRATCRGEFTMPPAKVEEMYTPENFGRCASEKCIID
ncbi:hypothetical protein L7F22_006231 [Adiantum nelumboides]|nr:hypothetical protein [Adiantum nelumboides]